MDNFETIIAEMRRYAEANNVPIIEDDSIKFINKYIELNNVKSILEIGTAIGYSAMLMASASPDVEVTTIERDDKKYREAVKNINRAKLDKRIEIVYNDALDVNLAGYKYDLIFIDAAKSQLIKYFEKFKNYLNPGGVIITDNIKFHGLVAEKDKIESKNVRQLVDKIEDYKEYLQNNDEFITKFYDVGDGLAVSFRRDNESIKGID
jgi:predicted O-methyltransferase YrrM